MGAGDLDGADQAMKAAIADGHKIVEIDVVNNRVVINSMETRPMVELPVKGLVRWISGAARRVLLELLNRLLNACQWTSLMFVFKLGMLAVALALRYSFIQSKSVLLGRRANLRSMVRWQQSRSDCFLSDLHGRDNRSQARAAIDETGRILALQVTAHANMGAWLSNFSTYIPTLSGCRTLTTVYDIKAASLQVIGVMTNTPAVDAYRGAGRPEANYLMERLMDHIAVETGYSRLDVRRVNMIKASQMPYEMVSGGTIDSGDIPQLFEAAIKQADVAGFCHPS